MIPDLFLSFDNPIIISFIILIIILSITYIYYRYVVIPMRKKHIEETESLRLQQAELMALFSELSPDAILRIDNSGKIILTNNTAYKVFHDKNLLGENITEVLPDLQKFDLQKVINDGLKAHFTTEVHKEYYQFLIAGVPKLEICQIYGRNITELKRKEHELKLAFEKAEQSDRLKSEFLAQMSHEIRTPINNILSYISLVKEEIEESMSEDVEYYFKVIEDGNRRLIRTIDMILNMSQIETGAYSLKLENFDLIRTVLEELLVEFTRPADKKKIKLHFECSAKNTSVYADTFSTNQIFSNLIDNALKYTSEGYVKVHLFNDDKDNVCVSVEDTGRGISPEYMKNLFKPFSQEQGGYTREYEGNGLGLALVKKYVSLNEGDISVKSTLGEGTTFTVTLPPAIVIKMSSN